MRMLVLAGALLLIPTTAASSEPLGADAFVQRVLEGPAGEAIDQAVELERARARGAGLWPNPSVSWNRESLPGSGVAQSTQDIVWLSVPLVLSGRIFLESTAAEDVVESARLVSSSRRADLRRRAIVLFYRALLADRRRALAEEARARFAGVAAIIEERAAAGETSGYDALRLEMEQADIEDRAADATLRLVSAKAEMRRLSGVQIEALSGELAPRGAAPAGEARPLSDRIRALEHQVEAARRRASAAARKVVPDPIVGVGVQHQGGEGRDGFTGYYVGVQVPLPLFDRGQGASAYAAATADRLELERRRLLDAAAASLAEAKQRLASNRARFARQSANAEKGEALVEIARQGYALGGLGLLTLLDAERAALEARLRAADRAFDVRRAEADVAFLTGADDREGATP